MNKTTYFVVTFLLAFNLSYSNVNISNLYYTYKGEKKILQKVNKLFVYFGKVGINKFPTYQYKIEDTLYNGFLLRFQDSVSEELLNSHLLGDDFVSHLYKDVAGNKLAFTKEIVVKCSSKVLDSLTNLCNQSNLKLSRFKGIDNVYIITLKSYSSILILKTLREIENNFSIDYVEPNFLTFGRSSSNDSLYSSQWFVKNTGQFSGTVNSDINVEPAWNITEGDSNITIAVLEAWGSIPQFNHPDISMSTPLDPNNFGFNAYGFGGERHGMPCAGIIKATKDNTTGVAGICPQCKLLPVKIGAANSSGGWNASFSQTANSIIASYQNSDIISNSNYFGSPSSLVDNAITDAYRLGREGKGVLFFSSAGNDNNTAISYPASFGHTVCVGAMSMCNQRKSDTSCDGENWWGGNYGGQLDVSAPGVKIQTTDIVGSGGYTSTDYTLFNGTSSACPIVAGIAGLCLSANPCLTGRQVRQVIEETCVKTGGYPYNTIKEHGSWTNELGYGRVNAHASVQESLIISPPINDSCLSAILVESDTICNNTFGTVQNAKPSGFPIPVCNSLNSPFSYDVWYKFAAKSDTHKIQVIPEGTNADSFMNPVIALYSSCNADSAIECFDNQGLGLDETAVIGGLVIGKVYYVRIYHNGPSVPINCNFNICVSHVKKHIDLAFKNQNLTINNNVLSTSFTIINNGNDTASTFKLKYYLSASPTFNTFDYLLDSTTILKLNPYGEEFPIVKAFNPCDYNVADWTYYLGVIIDIDSQIHESNETNNNHYWLANPFVTSCYTDLILDSFQTLINKNTIDFSFQVSNIGSKNADSFEVGLYYSKSSTFTGVEKLLYSEKVTSLQSQSTLNVSKSINLCDYDLKDDSSYYFGVIADKNFSVLESIETNNKLMSQNSSRTKCFVDLILHISPGSQSGTISGSGKYPLNSEVNISAAPKSGWRFVNWTENGNEISISPFTSLKLSSDSSLVANFTALNSIIDLNKNIKLYPNPTDGLINISGLSNPIMVKVYSMEGRLLHSLKTIKTINLSKFDAGDYLINLDNQWIKISVF